MKKLSVVIPVYNGAETIGSLVEKVGECITGYQLEIVLVNDGSPDNSEAVCEKLATEHSNIKFISLRKNFGEHNAVICGLNYVTGDFVAIVDDDFQNPPEEIMKLVKKAEEGFDVVYSVYSEKKHSWFRNFGSKVNDVTATLLLDKPKDLYLSSFKVIRKEVVDEIIKYRGPFPYIDGLLLRVTRNIGTQLCEHQKREVGRSNYTLRKLINLHFNMFFNFSIFPLRMCTGIGFATFILGILLSALFIAEKLFFPGVPLGWTSVIVAVLVLSGVQMMCIGLLGEFLGKQYLDQNGTPQWVIKKEIVN